MVIKDVSKLREAIEKTIREAADFTAGQGGGEIQLYGRVENGEIYDYFTVTFAGHNNWIEGPDVVFLFRREWFDPLHDENYADWLDGEFTDEALKAEFIAHLQREVLEHGYDYDVEDPHNEWEEFAHVYPEKWAELLDQWRETWLDVNVPDIVGHAVSEIERHLEEERLAGN